MSIRETIVLTRKRNIPKQTDNNNKKQLVKKIKEIASSQVKSALLRFHRKIIFEVKKNQELVNRIKVFKSKTTARCLFRLPLKDIFGVYSNPLVVFSTWQTIFSSFGENFVVSRVVMAKLRWREEPNGRKKCFIDFFRLL